MSSNDRADRVDNHEALLAFLAYLGSNAGSTPASDFNEAIRVMAGKPTRMLPLEAMRLATGCSSVTDVVFGPQGEIVYAGRQGDDTVVVRILRGCDVQEFAKIGEAPDYLGYPADDHVLACAWCEAKSNGVRWHLRWGANHASLPWSPSSVRTTPQFLLNGSSAVVAVTEFVDGKTGVNLYRLRGGEATRTEHIAPEKGAMNARLVGAFRHRPLVFHAYDAGARNGHVTWHGGEHQDNWSRSRSDNKEPVWQDGVVRAPRELMPTWIERARGEAHLVAPTYTRILLARGDAAEHLYQTRYGVYAFDQAACTVRRIDVAEAPSYDLKPYTDPPTSIVADGHGNVAVYTKDTNPGRNNGNSRTALRGPELAVDLATTDRWPGVVPFQVGGTAAVGLYDRRRGTMIWAYDFAKLQTVREGSCVWMPLYAFDPAKLHVGIGALYGAQHLGQGNVSIYRWPSVG